MSADFDGRFAMMTDRLNQATRLPSDSSDSETEEHSTGLPGFRTWRGVYYFVLIVFVVCVVLLKAFELAYS
jgi:hypothetical protein